MATASVNSPPAMAWSSASQRASLSVLLIIAVVSTMYGVLSRGVLRPASECCDVFNATSNLTVTDLNCLTQVDYIKYIVHDSWTGVEMRFICIVIFGVFWLYLFLAYIGALKCGKPREIRPLWMITTTMLIVWILVLVCGSLLGGLPFTIDLLVCTHSASYAYAWIQFLSIMLLLSVFVLQTYFILNVYKVQNKISSGPRANVIGLSSPSFAKLNRDERDGEEEDLVLA